MDKPKYNSIWVQELPSPGTTCQNPDCDGFIETGKYEGSVICKTCKTAYRKSRFPSKEKGFTSGGGIYRGTHQGDTERILTALREVYKQNQETQELIKKLIK